MKWVRRLIVGGYFGILAAGVIAWMGPSAPAESELAGFEAPARGELANLASIYSGGRIRASSYDLTGAHHPTFAIDAEPAPESFERWSTHRDDATPWATLLFAGAADIELVRVHAADAPPADFTVSCSPGESVERPASNERQLATQGCLDVTELTLSLGEPETHITEIEAWGRLR